MHGEAYLYCAPAQTRFYHASFAALPLLLAKVNLHT